MYEAYLQGEKAKMDKFIADSGLNISGLENILSLNSWSTNSVSVSRYF